MQVSQIDVGGFAAARGRRRAPTPAPVREALDGFSCRRGVCHQSGFSRLNDLGLLAWSIESAVTKFPDEFTRNTRQCAEWRLEQVKG
jgi:hypothetical protein